MTLMQPAPTLVELQPNQNELSDLIINANENYSKYYELLEKYNAWQDWYIQQHNIFETLQ